MCKGLNLEVPTTINEWETVLTKMMDEKGLDSGFALRGQVAYNFIFAAYGITTGFYPDDNGNVHYGLSEPIRVHRLLDFKKNTSR